MQGGGGGGGGSRPIGSSRPSAILVTLRTQTSDLLTEYTQAKKVVVHVKARRHQRHQRHQRLQRLQRLQKIKFLQALLQCGDSSDITNGHEIIRNALHLCGGTTVLPALLKGADTRVKELIRQYLGEYLKIHGTLTVEKACRQLAVFAFDLDSTTVCDALDSSSTTSCDEFETASSGNDGKTSDNEAGSVTSDDRRTLPISSSHLLTAFDPPTTSLPSMGDDGYDGDDEDTDQYAGHSSGLRDLHFRTSAAHRQITPSCYKFQGSVPLFGNIDFRFEFHEDGRATFYIENTIVCKVHFCIDGIEYTRTDEGKLRLGRCSGFHNYLDPTRRTDVEREDLLSDVNSLMTFLSKGALQLCTFTMSDANELSVDLDVKGLPKFLSSNKKIPQVEDPAPGEGTFIPKPGATK